jgi:hypothetical protein
MHVLEDKKVEGDVRARVLAVEVHFREDEGKVMLLMLGVLLSVMVASKDGRRVSSGGRRRGGGREGGNSIVLHLIIAFCPFSLLYELFDCL